MSQLRITKTDHAEVRPGTVANITREYKDDPIIKDGWAVEVEIKGQRREVYVPKGSGELLPDTSRTADQIAFVQSLAVIGAQCHANSRAKGFWENRDKLEALAETVGLGDFARKVVDSQSRELMHAELSEACEGERKGLMSDHIPGFTMQEEELADVLIRILDHATARGLRIGDATIKKMEFNAGRERLHGKKY